MRIVGLHCLERASPVAVEAQQCFHTSLLLNGPRTSYLGAPDGARDSHSLVALEKAQD